MNINNKEKQNRYNQPTFGRTHSWCKQLKKTGNMDVVLDEIRKEFVYVETIETKNTNLVDRMVALEDLYKDENIDKEIANIDVKIKRKQEDKGKKLYEESLKIIEDYLEEHQNLDDEKKLFLYLFKAKVASHLNNQVLAKENYNEAQRILQEATDNEASWLDVIDYKIETVLEKGKIRHELLSLKPLLVEIKLPSTFKDVLLSKTYLDPILEKNMIEVGSYSYDKLYDKLNPSTFIDNVFNNIFQSLEITKFSKLVGQLNALNALEHTRFNIVFIVKENTSTTGGTFNMRNTIRITVYAVNDQKHNIAKKALFHELTHKAMGEVFNNNCNPYLKGDEVAKKAYRDSMKKVLINIIRTAARNIPDNLESLEFNELVALCFGPKNTIKISSRDQQDLYVLYGKLKEVFALHYQVSELDAEFITNASDFITNSETDAKCLEIIQPLMEYVDQYVIREMEKYIEGHPRRADLQE